MNRDSLPAVAALPLILALVPPPATPVVPAAFAQPETTQSDRRAVEIAESVMEAMGGRQAWDETRYISWDFMGRDRRHWWDKWTGNHRIETTTQDGDDLVMLFNINTMEGRFWRNGQEVTDPDEVEELRDRAHGMWINDTYWMFMPYKLLDPGVTLEYMGEEEMQDGRVADVLQLTFDDVGRTPQNRYLVYVARDSGLVEQWSWFRNASDAEPQFTLPWDDWQRFGDIMLCTDHGRGADWDIQVHEELPEPVFTSPEPVAVR